MANCALQVLLLISVLLLAPCRSFRTDRSTGVLSFNNMFIIPFSTGPETELDGINFRFSMQRYRSLFGWSCCLLVKIFDKTHAQLVDYAKIPCGEEKKTYQKDGTLNVGELIYNTRPNEIVFMMKGGGCVIRSYVKVEGAIEMRMTSKTEEMCQKLIEIETGSAAAKNTEVSRDSKQ